MAQHGMSRLARRRHAGMNCSHCGKDNVEDARFCVHCGARQSVPTPIAAVAAAAMSRGAAARAQAANAAHAEPGAALAGEHRAAAAAQPRATPAAWPPPEARASGEGSAGNGAPASPSPASGASPRLGLAAALVAGCVVVGIIAFAGWHVLRDGTGADTAGEKGAGDASVMSSFPPENTPHRTAAPAAVAPPPPAAESAPNPERT